MFRPRLLLLLLSPFSFLPACSSISPPQYRESPPFRKPPADVLPAVLDALESERFTPTTISLDQRHLEASQTSFAPSHLEGFRLRAQVRIESLDRGTVVRLRVEREVNTDIVTPVDERTADWGRGEPDGEMEQLLLDRIRMNVNPPTLPPGARRPARAPR